MERALYEIKLDRALAKIRAEVLKAKEKYPTNFNSVHEGYAVLAEETDELWDEVKAKEFDKAKGEKECVQAGAMVCRFIVELTENN